MSECENHTVRIETLESDMKGVKKNIYGVDGAMGMATMVAILWRTVFLWPMMFVYMLVGSALTVLVTWAIKHIPLVILVCMVSIL